MIIIDIFLEIIIPLISVTTFIMSLLTLLISSLINKRRLIIIPHHAKKFDEIDENLGGGPINSEGVVFIFTVYNPSPYDIGIGNFDFIISDTRLSYDIIPRSERVILDGFLSVLPDTDTNYIIKANSQKRFNFLVRENMIQKIDYTNYEINFNAIFFDYTTLFKNPIHTIKNKRPFLKKYSLKGSINNKPFKITDYKEIMKKQKITI